MEDFSENEIGESPPQCPNCNHSMTKEKRDSALYIYYRCPECKRSIRRKKKLDEKEILFIMAENLDKIKMEISCILLLIILLVLLNIGIFLYIN